MCSIKSLTVSGLNPDWKVCKMRTEGRVSFLQNIAHIAHAFLDVFVPPMLDIEF